MDEVDKIIIHSLKQIGCTVEMDDDSEVFGLQHFTPDLLVKAVSKCLKEIKTDAVLPKTLPENMAQRFTVATSLAEMCSSCGYRGDIGYQTFLYPNVVDIRRLFMFLIEQLPKEQLGGLDEGQPENKDDFDLLMREVRKKIRQQLKAPWVPQYCRGIANRKLLGCSGLSVEFLPQINLNIPEMASATQTKDEHTIVTYQIPNIFQQTSMGDYDLVSSVLHKNAIDVYAPALQSLEDVRLSLTRPMPVIIPSPVKTVVKSNETPEEKAKEMEISIKSPLEKLNEEVESLKLQNDQIVRERLMANVKLQQIRQQRSEIEKEMEVLKKQTKIHERTSVILENPKENLDKLENLIEKTRERRLTMENQWQLHRNPALQQIDELQKLRQTKNLQSIHELRNTIQQLETALVEKTHTHAVLAEELKKATSGVASRREYTRRIYEFIGNIRKQRNDIYKILDDTKDLQKQLNSVSAQLQRQFNYTDDLLFQSAKHDLHAKQAYKLLASLHASCNEICDLVSRTGQMTKDSRDLEVQIDRERMRNVAASLEKITLDIQKFEMIIKTMKLDITQVENEIYSG
ncbi:coiled-coil domain-containing protein 22 homolog [Lucilia cuprina]|uniref:coiled-coil domain-containing protein 22 homolog n=1 Tax=Lucilia cuprina TaxID=7375 RepID=UPI001F065DD4|nr:coiled-coil domain-containing protein 22 homolog [Lucilia cuprina]